MSCSAIVLKNPINSSDKDNSLISAQLLLLNPENFLSKISNNLLSLPNFKSSLRSANPVSSQSSSVRPTLKIIRAIDKYFKRSFQSFTSERYLIVLVKPGSLVSILWPNRNINLSSSSKLRTLYQNDVASEYSRFLHPSYCLHIVIYSIRTFPINVSAINLTFISS
ncbi:hypothetical protein RirG_016140 [Rhizophagus irregularis DAOM 197198w]|uniref:Uncharacterized protein n=1 Tax=Rhizophagus irregularis (strain DAOM 197198w) TaxID=1432141 RepID=A0A015LF46_RHIIW|nr:hypothetical protein RirG_016140 [Rhizophagus irregularis DAOM 197198w]